MSPGDWIAGFLTKTRGHRLLYAMEVGEVLDLDAYFHDPRFQPKKPDLRGGWQQRCGDNFYSRDSAGQWIQHRNRFHLTSALKAQDTQHPRAFVSERFWYLGRSAVSPPSEFALLIGARGIRINHDPQAADRFRQWVDATFEQGVADVPNDNPDMAD